MEDGEERLRRVLALFARGLPDCRQVECSGGGNRVVEAYEGQVLWNAQAEFVRRAERTLCEPVAETEEGGRAGDLREDGCRATGRSCSRARLPSPASALSERAHRR